MISGFASISPPSVIMSLTIKKKRKLMTTTKHRITVKSVSRNVEGSAHLTIR